jgi:hypothetical protein
LPETLLFIGLDAHRKLGLRDIIEELFIAQMVPQTNKVHKYFNFLDTVNGRIEA